MFYRNEAPVYRDGVEIDLSKPICAVSYDQEAYILLPVDQEDSYSFRGYDWFNPKTGRWNSCANFKTVAAAISPYRDVRNCDIHLALPFS
ncbi:hypothetical protein [Vibrio phage RYC]|nr:hypothetical protein [Vibrio phage RYC]